MLSLNVNLSFKCSDTSKLIELFDPKALGSTTTEVESKEPISTDAIELQMSDSPTKLTKQPSLGQFTLKAFDENNNESKAIDFDKIETSEADSP